MTAQLRDCVAAPVSWAVQALRDRDPIDTAQAEGSPVGMAVVVWATNRNVYTQTADENIRLDGGGRMAT